MNTKNKKTYIEREACENCNFCMLIKHPHYTDAYSVCTYPSGKLMKARAHKYAKSLIVYDDRWFKWSKKNHISLSGVCDQYVNKNGS